MDSLNEVEKEVRKTLGMGLWMKQILKSFWISHETGALVVFLEKINRTKSFNNKFWIKKN